MLSLSSLVGTLPDSCHLPFLDMEDTGFNLESSALDDWQSARWALRSGPEAHVLKECA